MSRNSLNEAVALLFRAASTVAELDTRATYPTRPPTAPRTKSTCPRKYANIHEITGRAALGLLKQSGESGSIGSPWLSTQAGLEV